MRLDPRAQRNLCQAERPRERLLRCGTVALSDAELLAVMLGSGHSRCGNAIEMCRKLLESVGDLKQLSRVRAAELLAIGGIGPARTCAVLAMVELGRRIDHGNDLRSAPLRSTRQTVRLLRPRLAHLTYEAFFVVSLDARHRPFAVTQVAQGSATGVAVHPREVFTPLVRDTAAAAIVAHNHPSGDITPSAEDIALTKRLKHASAMLGIPLIDHLIIGLRDHASLVAT